MAIATLAALAALAAGRRAVAEYTIDLDLPPGERYNEALTNPVFNTTVWKFCMVCRAHAMPLHPPPFIPVFCYPGSPMVTTIFACTPSYMLKCTHRQ